MLKNQTNFFKNFLTNGRKQGAESGERWAGESAGDSEECGERRGIAIYAKYGIKCEIWEDSVKDAQIKEGVCRL